MKTSVAIVGGGACALMLACELDPEKFEVSVYEKNAALGRKFLVAGEGGLNLTHSENKTAFIKRYSPAGFFEQAFAHFSNEKFISWINALGIETYVGSSGRVFPKKGIKPVEVLNTLLRVLKKKGVHLYTKHALKNWSSENELVFENNTELKIIKSDCVIFCMGGASWSVTGSTGDWSSFFTKKKIRVNPFQPSNCSFIIHWPDQLVSKIEGKALKNISVKCGTKSQMGEIVITRTGIEGSGIYPFSPEIREQLSKQGKAEISLDFKPAMSSEKITEKIIARPAKTNTTEYLKKELHLSESQVQLLKQILPKEEFLNAPALAKHIKQFKLLITGTGLLEDAISSIGGIDLEEIDTDFQLKKWPDHYVIGEMLDYDAPTGGYLLQSCFSMANYLAAHLNNSIKN